MSSISDGVDDDGEPVSGITRGVSGCVGWFQSQEIIIAGLEIRGSVGQEGDRDAGGGDGIVGSLIGEGEYRIGGRRQQAGALGVGAELD